jgi:hypothetical protein
MSGRQTRNSQARTAPELGDTLINPRATPARTSATRRAEDAQALKEGETAAGDSKDTKEATGYARLLTICVLALMLL